eukprot:6614820-Pyramimonas_sp.AAC.1
MAAPPDGAQMPWMLRSDGHWGLKGGGSKRAKPAPRHRHPHNQGAIEQVQHPLAAPHSDAKWSCRLHSDWHGAIRGDSRGCKSAHCIRNSHHLRVNGRVQPSLVAPPSVWPERGSCYVAAIMGLRRETRPEQTGVLLETFPQCGLERANVTPLVGCPEERANVVLIAMIMGFRGISKSGCK